MKEIKLIQYQSYLFTIAYNMLGDVHIAEDVVQEVMVKAMTMDFSAVSNCKAYLSKMTINKSIDVLNEEKNRREVYKGLWLPEPLLLEEQDEHTIEYGLLFLLEKLNPQQRAVFVFKEAFNLSHDEIADMLDMNSAQSRQILHRAKEKAHTQARSSEVDPLQHQRLLDAFLTAVYKNDLSRLQEVLSNDIKLFSDGGGKIAAALKPIQGAAKVIKFVFGVMTLDPEAQFKIAPAKVNGRPGIFLYRNGVLDSVVYIEIAEDKIDSLYLIRNPDKILLNK